MGMGKRKWKRGAIYQQINTHRLFNLVETNPGDRGDARAPPKVSTGSSRPIANRHDGAPLGFFARWRGSLS